MVVAITSAHALDYSLCQYGQSKLMFRGPKKDVQAGYVTVIGGTDTFGRFVAQPFCDLSEASLGVPVINLGSPNAGIDAFVYDADILALAKGARLTVVQVMGAQNMSNRYYRVHPRRNDRFLGPSDDLKSRFPTVDFTEFTFVRHMLSTLHMTDPERFGRVTSELAQAWVARMRLLIRSIDGPVVVLWLRECASQQSWAEPMFIGADMVDDVAQGKVHVVEVPVKRAGEDREGMVYDEMEATMAAQMLNMATHHQIAAHLSEAIKDML